MNQNSIVTTPQQTTQETPTNQASNDDTEWLSYVSGHAESFSYDMNGITTSINKGDFSSLQGYSECLMMETDLAIKEDKKYHLSSKYQAANDEWVEGLQDYNSGAKDVRQVALDAQNGKVNVDATSEGADLCKQGTAHIKNANDLI
jgi:hypothetical protein